MKAVKNHRFGQAYIFDGNDGSCLVRDDFHCLGRFVEAMGGTLVNEENVDELCCSDNKWLISRYSSRSMMRCQIARHWLSDDVECLRYLSRLEEIALPIQREIFGTESSTSLALSLLTARTDGVSDSAVHRMRAVLDLKPMFASAGAIAMIGALRDNPLEGHVARDLEQDITDLALLVR